MKKYILSIATLCIIALASFAQNGITPLSEPFYDGTAMYLYNVHAQKFYTAGNEWGTRASIGDEGIKVYLEKYLVDGVWDGKTVIFRDSVPERNSIYDVFIDNEAGEVWVDRAEQPNYFWELTQSGSYSRFSMAAVCPDYESFYRPGTYLGWDSTLDEGNNSRLWAFMDPAISNHVDWVFISEASYEAVPKRSVLQATIEQAKLFGIDVSAYELIANNSQATYDELGMAIENLQATINGFVIQQIQGATPSNPKDATSFIKNPQFTEDVTAWQGEPVWGANCAEKFSCNFNVYQDLTGLPNGYYKVYVQGFYRAGDGGSTSMDQHAFLYANEISIPLMNINAHAGNEAFEGGNVSDVESLGIVPNDMATASTAFSAGLYADNTLTVLVTDGTLRIGIKKETLIENDWTIFDNFELYYLGTESEMGTVPLTADLFKTWDSVGADASSTGAATAELHVGEELGGGATVYGDPSVYFLTFADLTGYDKIVFEGTPGVQLRVLFNRLVDEGQVADGNLTEVDITIGEDGKTEVDLTDYEFVHLNAIKIGWGSPVGTVTAINLVKAAEHETPAGVVVVAADFEDGNVPFFSWHDNTRTVVDGVLEISIPETVDTWGQQMAYDNFFEYNAIYTMKFKVKGSAAGSISANFQVTTDAYKDAGNFGAIEFGTEWTEFESSVTVSQKAADRLIFNLSSFAGTVYMDDFVLTVVRPEAGGPEVWTNILTNCDLEGEADFSFIAVSNDPNKFDSENGEYIRGIAEIIDGIGKDGSRGIKVKSFAGATENWDAQFWIVMPQVLPAGTKYRISFDYRASTDVTVETEAHANPTEYIHYDMLGSIAFTPEWQHYEKSGVISNAQASNADGLLFKSIAFDLAIDKENDVEFYFDNIIYEVLNFVPETPTTKVAYLCGATETTEAIYTALVNAGMDVTPLNYDDVYLTEEIVANDFVGKYDLVVLAGSTGSSTPLAQTANLLLGKVNVLSTKSFWYQHYGTKGTNPGTADNPSLNLVKSIADHPIFAGIAGEEFAVFNDMAKASGRYLQGNGSFADGPEQITLATANGTDCIGEAWVNGKGYLIIPVDGAQPEGYLTADGEALYVNAANYLINGEQYDFLEEEYKNVQGILYQLNSQNTFTVTGYDETLNSDIVILENIEGKPVTHIKAGAFKNAYALKSVTIPSSITNVGVSAFSGCHNLLVVKWNTVAPLNADCFDNPEEYGNMLIFVTNANLTRNYKGNVVVNGVAENIQLIDGRPFRNPQEFTAKKISYTRHFTKKSKVGAPAGWEGMVLPFDVQTITSETKGLLAPFGKSNLTSTRPFWMARWQTSSEWFTRSTVFAANEPFIIAMPNSDEYDESFNIEGDVIFFALNTKVHTTDLQSEDGNFSLNGCYESVPSSSQIYALNDEEYTAPRGGGVFMPGGAFVANSRDIRPFEAYIYNTQLATTRRYIPVQGGGIATGIDRIMLKEGKQCVDVYTLQGIMVKHQIPVEDLEKDLPKGIYVVDGKKFVVK